jgi:hypothetical protein
VANLLVECRVAYNRGGKGLIRSTRAGFTVILANRIRQLTPHVFESVGSPVVLHRSTFAVWTETPLQGAEHRPELLVELFAPKDLPQFNRLEPLLTDIFARVMWSEVVRLGRLFTLSGFQQLTVQTLFPVRSSVHVDIHTGMVLEATGSSICAGAMFVEDEPGVQDILRRVVP